MTRIGRIIEKIEFAYGIGPIIASSIMNGFELIRKIDAVPDGGLSEQDRWECTAPLLRHHPMRFMIGVLIMLYNKSQRDHVEYVLGHDKDGVEYYLRVGRKDCMTVVNKLNVLTECLAEIHRQIENETCTCDTGTMREIIHAALETCGFDYLLSDQ